MMKRRILIALLAVGTVGGYASGFAHLRHMRGHCAAFHQAAASYGCSDGPREFRVRDDGPGLRDFRSGEDSVRDEGAKVAPPAAEGPK